MLKRSLVALVCLACAASVLGDVFEDNRRALHRALQGIVEEGWFHRAGTMSLTTDTIACATMGIGVWNGTKHVEAEFQQYPDLLYRYAAMTHGTLIFEDNDENMMVNAGDTFTIRVYSQLGWVEEASITFTKERFILETCESGSRMQSAVDEVAGLRSQGSRKDYFGLIDPQTGKIIVGDLR